MAIIETSAKSILRKHKRIDSWFISRYGMNLYRGCVHNCAYCDGRDEKYQVGGEFGRDIEVKVNAIDLLDRELNPARKRVPFKNCYIMVGGGVGDSYQPAEKKYRLTRGALELLIKYQRPAHMLTKSDLIERDIDLLGEIQRQSGAIASFSFSTVDPEIGKRFEPGVPDPARRLTVMEKLKASGIPCGMFLMPVLPYVTDSINHLETSVKAAVDHGADFVIFGGLTLKPGKQMAFYYDRLNHYSPGLVEKYKSIYIGNRWGNANAAYYDEITRGFNQVCQKIGVPRRIPRRLFKDILDVNDTAVVMLEHLDYILKSEGQKSPYGYAAYSISQLKQPISENRGDLTKLKGVGQFTKKILDEIIDTGSSTYYERICG